MARILGLSEEERVRTKLTGSRGASWLPSFFSWGDQSGSLSDEPPLQEMWAKFLLTEATRDQNKRENQPMETKEIVEQES